MAKQVKRSSGREEKNNDRPERKGRDKDKGKPSFNRYRDESRPSEAGTRKPVSRPRPSGSDKPFRKEAAGDAPVRRSSKDSSFSKERESGSAKKPYRGAAPKSAPKKRAANPYDLDESDFEQKDGPAKERSPYAKRKTYKKTAHRGKGPKTGEQGVDDGTTRLNKYIANAGICSRREADDLIASGVVQVNGKTITEMGYKVKPTDIIKYGGQTLRKEKMVYLILNKPKDFITTIDDPEKRRTVLELVQDACRERIYPVGRLDRATTGLLLFTNDGELTKKLTHPRYGVRKIYHISLDKPLKRADLDQIAAGIELEDGEIIVDEISYVGDGSDKAEVGVELHSGRNRIVRRIFESLGYNVRKLDRVMFGPLTKKDLPRGRWRFLTEAEVGMLKTVSADK